MALTTNYALRIGNLAKPTDKDPNGRRINFYFSKNVIPAGFEYVEVSFNMGRIVFVFMKDRNSYPKNYAMKRCMKLVETSSNNLRIASCSLIEFIELMKGWEGEYDELPVFPQSKLEDHKFYIKREMRHGYTNIMAGSSAEFTKKADILAEMINKDLDPISMPIDETKPTLGEAMEKFTNNVKETLSKVVYGEPKKSDILPPIEDEEDVLCKAILDEASICCQNMQAKVSDLLEYRLRKRELSVSEAEGNAEFNKIVVKYIRLYNAIEDLMKNVRHTWGDGRGLYDKYKKTKEDYPNMSDEDVAKFLHVTPEMLLETKEAIERILEDTKDRVKIGFNMEG